MKWHIENLGLWFVGSYLALVGFSAIFPGDAWYPFGAMIKMIPSTLLWPCVVLLEKTGTDSGAAFIILYAVFGPVCYWGLGKFVSLIAIKVFPLQNEIG